MIKEWYDREIGAGEEWRNVIDDRLGAADIILLLVSPDFIASDYCWSNEIARAMERYDRGETHVIPIIVRPVDWSRAPFRRLQALPKNGKPITLWVNRDVAWLDVATGIGKVAEALASGLPVEPLSRGTYQEPLAVAEALASGLPVERAPSGPSILPSSKATPIQNLERRLAERPGGQLRRAIYNAKNTEDLPGKVVRSEGDTATGDVAVDEVYDGLGITYNFFWDVYERNSIDDKGLQLNAAVHYKQKYDNAFWNGERFVYGDGDGVLFNRFTTQVDVIAKEFVKGVIQVEAQLVYWQQSGALIESISSVFASLVKQYALKQRASQADWLIGAGLLGPKVNGRALNSLADPGTAYDDLVLGKDPQSAHMRNYVRTTRDNGGVHINSGIPSRAFYLVATALGGYAWEKAGHIWYETLRDKRLKPKAQFLDFARITLANARQLYGDNGDEALAVKHGWEMVGIKVVRTQ